MMKLHKTRQERREFYRYEWNATDEMPQKASFLIPGRDGVTEELISELHRMDDREVESNLKAITPELSLKRKELQALRKEKKDYSEKWKQDFIRQYGYTPCADDVRDAVETAFPKNHVLSLDGILEGKGVSLDKTMFLADCDLERKDHADPLDLLHELIRTLSPRDQQIYQMVVVKGRTQKSAAEAFGISEMAVSKVMKKIRGIIADNENLKKFFR